MLTMHVVDKPYNYSLIIALIVLLNIINGFAQKKLSLDSYAYKKIEAVYNKVKAAAGDYRRELPKLVLMERAIRVASYRSQDNTLIIEKKAFDVCESMGKDVESALAFLIGHELTHFYQQHDWEELGFGTTFLVEKEIFDKHVHHETEADVYGAFIAYVAGYNTLELIPVLLDKLYKTYNLEDNLVNYPSLSERKRVTEKVKSRVLDLIKVYDNANYFTALGWHIQAVSCYEYLLKFLKTKELYNNLGASLLAIAIQQQDNSYCYPLELDLNNVLRGWVDKTEGELLEFAMKYIKIALEFDGSYFTGYLNLAIIYDLEKEYDQAQTTLKLASSCSQSVIEKANIAILEGIIYAHLQDKKLAEIYFNKAYNFTINLAIRTITTHNIKVSKGERIRLETEPMTKMQDMLDGVPLLESPPIKFHQTLTFLEGFMGITKMHFSEYPHSDLVCLETKSSFDLHKTYFVLQSTQKLSTHKGIRVGSTVSSLRKVYDSIQNPKIVHHRNGYFLIYRSLGLIFKINNKELLEEWALFLTY